MRANNVPYKDCRSDYNIHIFIVNKSVLDDPSRFGSYFRNNNRQETSLLGYYDSTLEIEKNSVLLVANIDYRVNDALLAHELSHYWWDRMCLGRYWQYGTEHFSDAFQEYYEDQR
jgi:predicted SprT family Zn-dependent metalloprotease